MKSVRPLVIESCICVPVENLGLWNMERHPLVWNDHFYTRSCTFFATKTIFAPLDAPTFHQARTESLPLYKNGDTVNEQEEGEGREEPTYSIL